jgi:hypothetical protein
MDMKKHKFNIFPEAKKEDFERLKADIETNGFDKSQPITTYENAILDGWNRLKACEELLIAPVFTKFEGTAADAIAFVMRTNKRRNLNSGQWATIAAEAEELIAVIAADAEKARREKISENNGQKQKPKETTGKKISPSSSDSKEEGKTAAKVAEVFNTNSTYVKNAVKMKEAAPEVFEKVKAGTMTMQDGMKAVRSIPTDPWSESERSRQTQIEKGFAVVANAQADKNLISWADSQGKAMRVDRGSKFGNPFVLNDDGTRDHVCDCYENSYLPNKPSILQAVNDLKGKVLICHCYPLRCHGDSLAALANGQSAEHKKTDPVVEAKRLRKLADKLDPPSVGAPSIEAVEAWATENGLPDFDVEKFYNHYELAAWKYGKAKTPIKDWKRAALNAYASGKGWAVDGANRLPF